MIQRSGRIPLSKPDAAGPALRLAAVCCFALGILAPAAADQIRGIIVSTVTIPSDPAFENTVALTMEEMAVVELDKQTPFLTDVRLELRLSDALKRHFDTFALAVYKSVSPAPRQDRRYYEGQRAFFQYLPYLNRIYVVLPIEGSEEPGGPPGVGTYRLEHPLKAEEFPLLVTLLPLAKGVPSAIVEEKFYLTFRPGVLKRGFLEIALRLPPGRENQTIRLFIDDRELPYPVPPMELPAGLHQVRILSPAFKEVSASVAVESGRTVRLELPLEELTSTVRIDAPEGAEVFLDGKRVTAVPAGQYPIEPGEHTLRIRIGDYSHSRKFTVEAGKHYHLGVVFDIIVNEW